MNYRKFGNTGEKISALGFGCMRFPEYEKDGKMYVDQDKVDEMVAEAYRQGVNYFDTAPKYCNCNSEEAVGRAVKGFRDKVLLSTKIPLDVCKKPGNDWFKHNLATRMGIEPTTSAVTGRRSNQLSHRAKYSNKVDLQGLEPRTDRL